MDTHVHTAPDVFGRALDDEEVATLYRDRGLEALVLKNHVATTADRAWFARKHVAGLKVFGGIALNSASGGINPDAVNWMARMQGGFGRVVWFPTFDSDNHVKHFKDAPKGIKVLGTDGKVLPAVRDVLKICAEQKLVVQTGHLSPTEALAVIAAGRDAGVDRLVVTHAQFEVVNMSVAQMKEAAGMGAKLELCAMGPLLGPEAQLEWMRHLVTCALSPEHDGLSSLRLLDLHFAAACCSKMSEHQPSGRQSIRQQGDCALNFKSLRAFPLRAFRCHPSVAADRG
jgi:hypothetical protein